ncbi:MAG TPA: sulfotransferase [Chthoniobacterales bacterium]|jgi:hypothetical protein|nr:sulfotransferase [Chthoniobacterales bacterium]
MASVGVNQSAPLVIGATGGSGTRVVARIARHAGYDLGTYLNEAGDALAFQPFFNIWTNRFLRAGRRGLRKREWAGMESDFEAALSKHLSTSPAAGLRWGWKAPRSIYLLPFLHLRFPELKFIHIVRDGRDMAFSNNQNQVLKHGRAVLNPLEYLLNPVPIRSILLWDRVNARAAEFGETKLCENYHLVHFEDLCRQPIETTARLLRFLGTGLDARSVAETEVSPPTTLGRWKTAPPMLIARLERSADRSLRKFGYLT